MNMNDKERTDLCFWRQRTVLGLITSYSKAVCLPSNKEMKGIEDHSWVLKVMAMLGYS